MTTYSITSSHRNPSLPVRTVCYKITAMTGEKLHGGESPNERFAWNLRLLREQADMSQAALAAAMRERGKPWHQSTVARVESGKQPAGFEEAAVLAEILGASLDRFTWTSQEAMATAFVVEAGKRLRQKARTTADVIVILLAAVEAAEQALEMSADSPYPRVQEARAAVARDIGLYGVEGAVAEARQRYAEERKADKERAGNDTEDPARRQDIRKASLRRVRARTRMSALAWRGRWRAPGRGHGTAAAASPSYPGRPLAL